MDYQPTIQTIIFITVFLFVYIFILLRKTSRNMLDLYDLFLLCLVAIIPALFAYFPQMIIAITRFVGVYYPFELLFGLLFFIVFVFLYNLVTKNAENSRKILRLVQDISMLKGQLEEYKRQHEDHPLNTESKN